MGNRIFSMMLSKNTRIVELVYLLWSLLMAGYWLVLFENLSIPPVVPFGIAAVLLIAFAWGSLKQHNSLKKLALLFSFITTLIFSVLAWQLQPACDCYGFSFIDLVPNLVSIAMMAVIRTLQKTVVR